MITLGIDESKWQGSTEPGTLALCDLKFAYLKATHGKDSVDPFFATNVLSLTSHVALGAYYWFEPEQDPDLQADNFVKTTENSPLDLWPCGDLEQQTAMEGQKVIDRFIRCQARIEMLTGRETMTYSGLWYWLQYCKDLDSEWLGTRHYFHSAYPYKLDPTDFSKAKIAVEEDWPHGSDKIPRPWAKRGGPTLWQFDGDKGLTLPTHVDVDVDAFRGDIADLLALASPRTPFDPAPHDDTLQEPFGWSPQTSPETVREK